MVRGSVRPRSVEMSASAVPETLCAWASCSTMISYLPAWALLVAVAPRISVAAVEEFDETKADFCSKTLLRKPVKPGGLRRPFTVDCSVLSSALNSLKAAIRVSVWEIFFPSPLLVVRLTDAEAFMLPAFARPACQHGLGRAWR